MPLTYPLTLPTTGIRNITLRARSRVGQGISPFTGQRQVYPWPLQMWEADVTIPPLRNRADAESWVAFLVGLNGREGTFLLGDPASTLPRDGGLSAALISASPAISNGGFETAGGGGADVFANWTEFTGGTSAVVRDTSEMDSGSASARFDVDAAPGGFAGVLQAVLISGRSYRLTVRAKSTGGGTLVIWKGASLVDVVTLTTSWATYVRDFVADGTSFEISCATLGASLWVDSVELYARDGYGGLVQGGSQTGGDLLTDGWLAHQTNIMSAGDWLQIGTGSSARLHKVLQGANSNASGEATLLLWPKLRSSPADNAAVIVQNPVGLFALTDDVREWSIDQARVYGISFSAMEVLT